MASVFQRKGRAGWCVKFRDGDRIRFQHFKTEGEARAFACVSGPPPQQTARPRRLHLRGDRLALTGAEFLQLAAPAVYLWKRDGRALYVGFSAYGFDRIFSRGHEKLGFVLPGDELQVMCFATAARAAAHEKRLIRRLRPALNLAMCPGRHQGFGTRVTPSRDRVLKSLNHMDPA